MLALSRCAMNGRRRVCEIAPKKTPGRENLILDEGSDFATSFWEQCCTLTRRKFTQMSRDRVLWVVQLLPAATIGTLEACLFWGVGNDGSRMIQNLYLMLTFIFLALFQQSFAHLMFFPYEMKLLQREYSNRWYSLNAYYTSLSLTSLPTAIIPAILFTVPLYFASGQPLEADRFVGFLVVTILSSMAAQELGNLIGCLVTPLVAVITGSSALAIIVITVTHGIDEDEGRFYRVLADLTFARHAFAGFVISLLEGREAFDCEEIFCYFGDPDVALRLVGLHDRTFGTTVICLALFLVLYKVCVYLFLRLRLTPKYTNAATIFEYFERKLAGG